MSDPLDDKLDNLLDNARYRVASHVELKQEIRQVFTDAGYIDAHDYLRFITERHKPAGTLQTYLDIVAKSHGMPVQPETMTGPEWFNRFQKELPNTTLAALLPSAEMEYKFSTIMAAARRAAGIADKPQGV